MPSPYARHKHKNIYAVLSSDSESETTLQRLPAEIRNTIWEYAVTSHEPIDISRTTCMQPPPITQVCEQIGNETIGLYYSNNDFVWPLPFPSIWPKRIDPHSKVLARCTTKLKSWLASIPAQHHQNIRELRIADPSYRGFALVEACKWLGIWHDRQDDILDLVAVMEAAGLRRTQICFDIRLLRCDGLHQNNGTFLKDMENVLSRVGLRSRFTYKLDEVSWDGFQEAS